MPTQPRARGDIVATFGCADGETRLQTLRQAGSSRALFPRSPSLFTQMVLTNTSGGVTGGDRFRTRISVADGAAVSVTTQAAERAYRAQPGQVGRVATTLEVGHGSRINWLPQETILFDGCDFARRLTVSLEPDATALLVEPLVFGRTAMGETVRSGTVDDRIEVIASGRCVFLDRMRLSGDMAGQLARPAVAGDARAGAVVVFAAHTAEARLEPLRALLPKTGGASLLQPALLVARLLSEDAFELRRSLVPVLELLHEDVMPRPWMI
ncbi:MAG: urease accessory protein UreD [Pseudomonadota bacterium]